MATYTKENDVASTAADDPAARLALQEVFSNTARWPAGFKGFSANVTVNLDGKTEQGTVVVRGPKDMELGLQGEQAKEFAGENLASIASHRGPRSFEESDGKYKLSFGDDGSHPQGRIVIMGGDGMGSFYRIKDGRIHQINRKTPRFSFSINVEESVKNADNKFLTRKYTVYYFNADNSLKNVESYTDHYVRVGAVDLPESRRIIDSKDGQVVVTIMDLSGHKLL
jgi:hypothetical protein